MESATNTLLQRVPSLNQKRIGWQVESRLVVGPVDGLNILQRGRVRGLAIVIEWAKEVVDSRPAVVASARPDI